MKKILVPIGTQPQSEKTLQYAVDFAQHIEAELFVMTAFNSPMAAGNLSNVVDKIEKSNQDYLNNIISLVDQKAVSIKTVTYVGNVIEGLAAINAKLGIDLLIIAPRSTDINDDLYLGNTTGSIIKKTDIPTLLVPREYEFTPIKNILTAFKSGIVPNPSILKPLLIIKSAFDAKVNLLLVKTPNYTQEDLVVDSSLMDVSKKISITENQTTYMGVLEHFQGKKPDLLCVFRRKRGFFEKLWKKNTIAKSEFWLKIPVLVLPSKKNE
jgi:nucleotide-binding universal stress UspA family protein